MPHFITVANTKGGVGKSTIAVNLAVVAATAGYRTLLIDTDPQESSSQFCAVRDDDRPEFKALRITRPALHRMQDVFESFDCVLVDVGGRDAPILRSAIAAVDTIVIPVVLSAFDTWASADIFDIVAQIQDFNHGLKAYVIFNQFRPTIAAREALDELRNKVGEYHDIKLVDVPLHSRSVWPRAVGEGLSVTEWEPNGKASSELRYLAGVLGIRDREAPPRKQTYGIR
jgi:chromosome partitioning protein